MACNSGSEDNLYGRVPRRLRILSNKLNGQNGKGKHGLTGPKQPAETVDIPEVKALPDVTEYGDEVPSAVCAGFSGVNSWLSSGMLFSKWKNFSLLSEDKKPAQGTQEPVRVKNTNKPPILPQKTNYQVYNERSRAKFERYRNASAPIFNPDDTRLPAADPFTPEREK